MQAIFLCALLMLAGTYAQKPSNITTESACNSATGTAAVPDRLSCTDHFVLCGEDGVSASIEQCDLLTEVFMPANGTCVDADMMSACTPSASIIESAVLCEEIGVNFYFSNPLRACSGYFIRCMPNATAMLVKCAMPGFKFDVAVQKCVAPELVEACGGSPASRRRRDASLSTSLVNKGNITTDYTIDCTPEDEGRYGALAPCSSIWFKCMPGEAEARVYDCGMLVFDREVRECAPRERLDVCMSDLLIQMTVDGDNSTISDYSTVSDNSTLIVESLPSVSNVSDIGYPQ